MKSLLVPAPAKLNLFLHLAGRRSDGYHNLESVFVLIDYCDYLQFETTDDHQIKVLPQIEGVPTEDNLIFKAASTLQKLANERSIATPGVRINLTKNLPMGGGLGGGSSDCASTLMALNYLWDLNLSEEQLRIIGLKLGADVPFFIGGNTSFIQGIGEELHDFDVYGLWFLVIEPDFSIPTVEIFTHPDLNRNYRSLSSKELEDAKVALSKAYFWGSNYLESAAFKIYPQLQNIVDSAYPIKLRMSGSGSCLFAMFLSEAEAIKSLSDLNALIHKLSLPIRKLSVYKQLSKHPIKDVL